MYSTCSCKTTDRFCARFGIIYHRLQSRIESFTVGYPAMVRKYIQVTNSECDFDWIQFTDSVHIYGQGIPQSPGSDSERIIIERLGGLIGLWSEWWNQYFQTMSCISAVLNINVIWGDTINNFPKKRYGPDYWIHSRLVVFEVTVTREPCNHKQMKAHIWPRRTQIYTLWNLGGKDKRKPVDICNNLVRTRRAGL